MKNLSFNYHYHFSACETLSKTQPRTVSVWLMCTPIGLMFLKILKGEWREKGTFVFLTQNVGNVKNLFLDCTKVCDRLLLANHCGNCEALVIIGVTAT